MGSSSIISCGALIYCTGTKRYLFLLRKNGRYNNTWGIVGGKINQKETVIQGLKREIREELGGEIKDAKFINIDKFISNSGEFSYHTFLVKVEYEFVPELNNEHKGYCWVNLEDIPKPTHPGLSTTINNQLKRQNLKILESVKD
jgi:8-oxo-dGTP pyrophosphatase MutT (NUDIX family)